MTSHSERLMPNTMATKVYRKIREDIITGVFPPGTHLVRRALAKRYGVSMLPILEACLRLETDGLVENSPLVGAFVVDITPEKAREELILRQAIESQAAREFAVHASAREREQLMEAARLLDSIQDKLNPGNREHEQLFQRQHGEFHLAIARMSGAVLLYQQMKKVWYRTLMLVCNMNSTLFPNPKGWHVQLATALNSGDPDHADREMRRHVLFNSEKSSESVKAVLSRGREELIDTILNGTETDEEEM